jgi:hypothetical protein
MIVKISNFNFYNFNPHPTNKKMLLLVALFFDSDINFKVFHATRTFLLSSGVCQIITMFTMEI